MQFGKYKPKDKKIIDNKNHIVIITNCDIIILKL